jgi:hypothetical protein
MDPFEIYVLCGERSAAVAGRFLAEFAPKRISVATDFPFPEFVDEPRIVFAEPNELIRQLEIETSESYSIYWNVERGVADQVMLFFTDDGGMIVGLGGPQIPAKIAFPAIQKIVNGKYGYVTNGCSPPSSIDEFVSLCERSTLVNLFDGDVRVPNRTM